jgi:hypothetical protein
MDASLQLALSIGVPTLAVMIGILLNNSRWNDLKLHMDSRFNAVDQRFNAVDQRFNAVDQRFTDMKDMWRSELHRVEEVLDARLKHLEER